jgi:hypothetical protein
MRSHATPFAALAALALAWTPSSGSACSCAPLPPPQAFPTAGTVLPTEPHLWILDLPRQEPATVPPLRDTVLPVKPFSPSSSGSEQ